MKKTFFLFLLPALFFAGAYKPLIYLDPGHGGLDLGAKVRYPYMEEKKIALLMGHLTKRKLENFGYRVQLTRSRDFFLPLARRVTMANKHRADLFISLHFNSCPNKAVIGIEIFYMENTKQKKRNMLKH